MNKLLIILLLIVGCDKESEAIINQAKKEAEKIKNTAIKNKTFIISEAQKEAENIKEQAKNIQITTEKKLDEIFGKLKKYNKGKNKVNKKYIDSFTITGRTIEFTLINEKKEPIQPDFNIVFVNEYGFITAEKKVYWIIDRIKKGESRIEEREVHFNFGQPVYYYIDF